MFDQARPSQIRDPPLEVIAQLALEVPFEPLPSFRQEVQEPPHRATFDCINLRGIKVDEGPTIRQAESCSNVMPQRRKMAR